MIGRSGRKSRGGEGGGRRRDVETNGAHAFGKTVALGIFPRQRGQCPEHEPGVAPAYANRYIGMPGTHNA